MNGARFALFLVALSGTVVAIAVAIEPDQAEIAAIALEEGDEGEASREIERFASRDGSSKEYWLRLADIHRYRGDAERLGEALTALAASAPENVAAQDALAEHLFEMRRTREAIAALERANALRPDTRRYRRIIGRLRALGEWDAAARRLEEGLDAGVLGPEDARRLVSILGASGETERLLGALRRLDAAPDVIGAPARIALFDLLVAGAKFDEAGDRARSWLDDEDGGALLAANVATLLRYRRMDEAEALARAAVALDGDAQRLIVGALAEAKALAAARRVLATWSAARDLSAPADQRALVELSAVLESPTMAWTALETHDPAALDESAATALAEQMFLLHGLRGVERLKGRLSERALRRHPVFGAEYMLARRRPEPAIEFLRGAARPRQNASAGWRRRVRSSSAAAGAGWPTAWRAMVRPPRRPKFGVSCDARPDVSADRPADRAGRTACRRRNTA